MKLLSFLNAHLCILLLSSGILFLSSCASSPPTVQVELEPTPDPVISASAEKEVNINVKLGADWECFPSNKGNLESLQKKGPNIQICRFERISPSCNPSLTSSSAFDLPWPKIKWPSTICARLITASNDAKKLPPLTGSINAETFFCTNKSDLWKEESFLGTLARCYKKRQEERKLADLRIRGHADIRGEDKFNEQLSRQRACGVANYLRNYLIKGKGDADWKEECVVSGQKKYEEEHFTMEVVALGESKADPKEQHAFNRRVEIQTETNDEILKDYNTLKKTQTLTQSEGTLLSQPLEYQKFQGGEQPTIITLQEPLEYQKFQGGEQPTIVTLQEAKTLTQPQLSPEPEKFMPWSMPTQQPIPREAEHSNKGFMDSVGNLVESFKSILGSFKSVFDYDSSDPFEVENPTDIAKELSNFSQSCEEFAKAIQLSSDIENRFCPDQ